MTTTSEYFRIGYAEYVFISLLDGRTSFAEALAITSQQQKSSAPNQHQVDGLTLRAGRDGRVVGRELARLPGTYSKAGAELLTIGLENEKELQLSIGQTADRASIHSRREILRG